MAATNAPRGLVLARKNGAGSNSTGITTINWNNAHLAPSAGLPNNLFTGDPLCFQSAVGTIVAATVAVGVKTIGVFQGCSYVDGTGDQQFSRQWTGGITATDVKIHVASDPKQTYFIQMDATVTFAATIAGYPHNTAFVVGTGSTRTGQSAYMADADGGTVSFTAMRVIDRAPWDTGVAASATATDAFPWYEVRLNNHIDNFVTTTLLNA